MQEKTVKLSKNSHNETAKFHRDQIPVHWKCFLGLPRISHLIMCEKHKLSTFSPQILSMMRTVGETKLPITLRSGIWKRKESDWRLHPLQNLSTCSVIVFESSSGLWNN